jgi:peptidoglycan/LPS O-acetylase OafA/YrhL
MRTPANAAGEDKLLGVELLRFVCALAVLVFHYQHLAFVGTQPAAFFVATRQPFYSMLRPFYQFGFYGVEVFWCISGFIFFWKYGQAISRRTVGGYKFFVLRFSRLYPLHIVTLLFVAAMQMVYLHHNHSYFVYGNNDLPHFLLQLFMASNWLIPSQVESFNGPIWSISVEILVYGLFFLTLRYLSASWVACALIAVLAALVAGFKLSTLPVFFCVMYFYVGCLAAIVYARAQHSVRARALVSLGAALAVAGTFVATRFVDVHAVYVLLVGAPSLILLCTIHLRGSKRMSSLLVAAGSMTYSSYLLHIPIQLTVMTILSLLGVAAPIYSPFLFLAFILGTLTLSYWCYALFEMPAQNWLRRRLKAREAVGTTRRAAPAT